MFRGTAGGPAATAAYERMRDTILAEIKAALPLDGVVLALHGAMVAFGYDDCEGDLLERVRSLVGADCVIGVEFDPHCHLTRRKCAFADIIILFKEYPHTDFVARGEEVVTLVLDAIGGKVKPVLSLYDCRTIASFPTTVEPMRSLVNEIMMLGQADDILHLDRHGFPSADVPEMAPHPRDQRWRQSQRRHSRRAHRPSPDRPAGERRTAHGHDRPGNRPRLRRRWRTDRGRQIPPTIPRRRRTRRQYRFVRRLIERQVNGAAVAPIWDPMAVRYCFDAVSALVLRCASVARPWSPRERPVDAEVEVLVPDEDGFQTSPGRACHFGRTAAIRAGGVEIVLISTRAQAMGIDLSAITASTRAPSARWWSSRTSTSTPPSLRSRAASSMVTATARSRVTSREIALSPRHSPDLAARHGRRAGICAVMRRSGTRPVTRPFILGSWEYGVFPDLGRD
jgi:hypothetical protein